MRAPPGLRPQGIRSERGSAFCRRAAQVAVSGVMSATQETTPLFALGFRPFFLAGALYAALAVPAWAAIYAGHLRPSGILQARRWHAHEMLFGFFCAIVAGFLLTASQNWTGKPGVFGRRLQGLFLLWLLPRFGFLFPAVPYLLWALLDLLFIPALALSLFPYLGLSTQRRNQWFFVFFALLLLANLLFHLEGSGVATRYSTAALDLAINTALLIMALIGGRIIPLFSKNAIEGLVPFRSSLLEKGVFVSLVLYLTLDFFTDSPRLLSAAALPCFLLHAARFWGWQFWKTGRRPIVWILHAGYAWMILGFFLKMLVPILGLSPLVATHAFAAGGIGVLIFGMITRVALGHTGRPIEASRVIVFSYFAINFAALLRVFGVAIPALSPFVFEIMLVSAAFWSLAFFAYVVTYAPFLLRPRLDGKPG